jgi:malic enzyme
MLIGASTATGSFTEAIVKEMAAHTAAPIIFALSIRRRGPRRTPTDLTAWTNGRVLIATAQSVRPSHLQAANLRYRRGEQCHVVPGPRPLRDCLASQ